MSRFDPEKVRRQLCSELGYRHNLETSEARARSVNGLGAYAHACLSTGVLCHLCGLSLPAVQVIEKARRWLVLAIEEQEKPSDYAPPRTEAWRYHDLSLCTWLTEGTQDVQNLRRYAELDERFLDIAPFGKNRVEISLTLPYFVDADADERVVALFERTPGLTPASNLNAIRSEAPMCYAISRCRLGMQYSEVEVKSALRRFLDRKVDDWLVVGQNLRVATWMKIAYWGHGEAGLTPSETLLKAYDHLPGRSVPGR